MFKVLYLENTDKTLQTRGDLYSGFYNEYCSKAVNTVLKKKSRKSKVDWSKTEQKAVDKLRN